MIFNMPETKKPKKRLRKAVRRIKELNRCIAADNLWRGRFYARMVSFSRQFYSDNSGMAFLFEVEFVDLKTGMTKIMYLNEYDIHTSRLYMAMNDFIVLFVQAWQDNPKNDKTIYRRK